jgi:hypothetical protein
MTSLSELVSQFNDYTSSQRTDTEVYEWLRSNVPTSRMVPFAKKLAEVVMLNERLRISSYYYMLTITIDPDKHPQDTPELYSLVEDRITQLPTRLTSRKIVGLVYVREYTKAGRAHWHVAIRSETPTEARHFSWFRNHVGNIQFNRNRTNSPQNLIDYLSKDEEIVTVLPL